ncbi:hypothetical protein [Effusibacillus dendaii]|nr:hypothetical protein [Effusibacillus dendaii]
MDEHQTWTVKQPVVVKSSYLDSVSPQYRDKAIHLTLEYNENSPLLLGRM